MAHLFLCATIARCIFPAGAFLGRRFAGRRQPGWRGGQLQLFNTFFPNHHHHHVYVMVWWIRYVTSFYPPFQPTTHLCSSPHTSILIHIHLNCINAAHKTSCSSKGIFLCKKVPQAAQLPHFQPQPGGAALASSLQQPGLGGCIVHCCIRPSLLEWCWDDQHKEPMIIQRSSWWAINL